MNDLADTQPNVRNSRHLLAILSRMVDSRPFVFMATCATCHAVRSQAAYGYCALIKQLDDNRRIGAHCGICGQSWAINDEDRARLAKDLAVFR